MPDVRIEISARDEASPKFREVARAAGEMGQATLQAASVTHKGGESISAGVLKAQVAFAALQKAASIAIGVLKSGFLGLMESEQATFRLAAAVRQLGYDVDTLVPALVEQADAFERTTLVSAEAVQQIQQLLLRYGVAPRDIGRTTAALLDYAAATGKDARSSVETLMQALSGGGERMRAFGVTIERTGDRTKDLNALVEKMTEQFGGSAAAATRGLSGDIGRLQLAQENLSKALANFLVQTGIAEIVVSGLTQALEVLKIGIQKLRGEGPTAGAEQEQADKIASAELEITSLQRRIQELQRQQGQLRSLGMDAMSDALQKDIDRRMERIRVLQQEIAQAQEEIQRQKETDKSMAEALNQGASDIAKAISEGSMRVEKEVRDGGDRLERAFEENEKKLLEQRKKTHEKLQKLEELSWKQHREAEEERVRLYFESITTRFRRQEKEWANLIGRSRTRIGQLTTATAQQVIDEGAEQMEQAGIALGFALVGGLDQALTQMGQGGEMDIGAIIASLIPALVTLGVIAASGGAAAPFAPLIGQAAGVIVRHAFSGSRSDRRMHSGGWVGDELPRFHSGTWALGSDEQIAILQRGERVMSRREVANAGGPAAVDSMARGGGSLNITVQTMDSQSFTEFFGGPRGGAGFARAIVENRGEGVQQIRRLVRKAVRR